MYNLCARGRKALGPSDANSARPQQAVRLAPLASRAKGDCDVTLEVIGAGFGRTGTWSTYAALNQLGFPCYHMAEVINNKENKTHLGFWRKVANSPPGSQHDWNQVIQNTPRPSTIPVAASGASLCRRIPTRK